MTRSSLDEVTDLLAKSPLRTAILTDFDGTLSPIIAVPESAEPLLGAVEALHRLAARYGFVGVVSGRPAAFLVERFREEKGDPLELFGLHGLEHFDGEKVVPVPGALSWVAPAKRARDIAIGSAVDGLAVEDKTFGITLHWRRASDPALAGIAGFELATAIAAETGLVLRRGKASVELVPPIGIDKGSVVRNAVESSHAGVAAYIGDDTSDLPAFMALSELERAGSVRALRIAVTSAEAPADLLRHADLVLEDPAAATGLLVALARRLSSN